MTDDMDRKQAEKLLIRSKELINKPESGYVDAVLQIASKANRELLSNNF